MALGAPDGRDQLFNASLRTSLGRRFVHALAQLADRALPIALVLVEPLSESNLPFEPVEECVADFAGQLAEGQLRVGLEMLDDGEQRGLQ